MFSSKIAVFIATTIVALVSAGVPNYGSTGYGSPSYGSGPSYGGAGPENPSYGGSNTYGSIAGVTVKRDEIKNSCNAGHTVHEAQSKESDFIHSLVGVDVNPVAVQAGVTCSPISVLGIAGNSCSTQSVCCSGNQFDGIVAVGCSPINANL